MIIHRTLESHAPQCWTACTDMCLSLAVLTLSVQSVGNVLMTCVALHSKQKTGRCAARTRQGNMFHIANVCTETCWTHFVHVGEALPQVSIPCVRMFGKNQKQAHHCTHDGMFGVSFPGEQTMCVKMT